MTSQVTLMLVIPIGIYYLRNAFIWFYFWEHTAEETRLGSLRAKQKLKVEELKKGHIVLYNTISTGKARRGRFCQKKKSIATTTLHQLPQRKPVFDFYASKYQCHVQGLYSVHQSTSHNRKALMVVPLPCITVGVAEQSSQRLTLSPSSKGLPQWYGKLIDSLIDEEGLDTNYVLVVLLMMDWSYLEKWTLLNMFVLIAKCPILQEVQGSCTRSGPVLPSRSSMHRRATLFKKNEQDQLVTGEYGTKNQADVENAQGDHDTKDILTARRQQHRRHSTSPNRRDENSSNMDEKVEK